MLAQALLPRAMSAIEILDVGPFDGFALNTTLPGIVAGLLSCVFAGVQYQRLMGKEVGKDIGKPLLDKLSDQVKNGAIAFLKTEYTFLAAFVLLLAIVLFVLFTLQNDVMDGIRVVIAFVIGAFLSALTGYLGMVVATRGNVRTTVACTAGTLNDGLRVAFTTGTVMGFLVVGLGLAGIEVVFLVLMSMTDEKIDPALRNLSAFGFGASCIALFARVAGGIYTKAADVGADLVGKVEAGIDEDDRHNPAVIADNVGDNVGDVAGMGADLFESYVGSLIAAVCLAFNGAANTDVTTLVSRMQLPGYLAAAGIICSIFGCFAVSTNQKGEGWNVKLGALMWALEKGMYLSGFLFIGAAYGICFYMFPKDFGEVLQETDIAHRIFGCIIIGLLTGMAIGKTTEYFTSFDFGPVISIKDRGVTGPATVVIQGIGVGMISCAPTTVLIVVCIMACAALDSAHGVAIAAVGMLATLGITLATDAYGPVADNAGGLAEMDPSIGPEVRLLTDSLDALGNTTAATGKGFAIASAVLTSLSLMQAFKERVSPMGVSPLNFAVDHPTVLSGILLGSMMPMLFAALTMISVGKAAAEIIIEVRRQFREIPGLKDCIVKASAGETITPEEDVLPDSDTCVKISTESSVREMIAPGLYAILIPLMVGFTVGPRCLMGVLAGAIASGCMNAIMMSNAGGAWDNSKKLCEKLRIKKTDQGKACVVGDTVGDPFKDTSGPALNILIKLMSMVSLTVAPLMEGKEDWEDWYFGMVPTVIFVVASIVLVFMNILTWSDPLGDMIKSSKEETKKEVSGTEEVKQNVVPANVMTM